MSAFHVGQRVSKIEFTDCFGKINDKILFMTITEVRTVESSDPTSPHAIPAYDRITATTDDGTRVQAAARFFVPEEE